MSNERHEGQAPQEGPVHDGDETASPGPPTDGPTGDTVADNARTDATRNDVRADAARADDATQADNTRAGEASRADDAQNDPRVDAPRADDARTDDPGADAPGADAIQADSTRADEASRADDAHDDIRADAPRADPTQADAPRAADARADEAGADATRAVNAPAYDPGADATRAAGEPGAGGGSGGPMDEEELRLLLRDAVRGLEPSDSALEHLHRAVPARRARKRQALVGAAAAALLCGTAVPAFMHVASVRSTSSTSAVSMGGDDLPQGGMSSDQQGATAAGPPPLSLPSGSSPSGTPAQSGAPSGSDGVPGTTPSGSPTVSATPGGDTFVASAPPCSTEQLGGGSARTGTPDDQGTVYGTFRVSNVSDQACTVSTPGDVVVRASGAADPARIAVVVHTAGDPATGLPAPSQDVSSLTLPPSGGYEVRFAFVPSDACHTDSQTPGATAPADTGTGSDADVSNDAASTTGPQTQLVREDTADGGGDSEGSIAVSHTPEPGAAAEQATISDACAGTVYRTGMLADHAAS